MPSARQESATLRRVKSARNLGSLRYRFVARSDLSGWSFTNHLLQEMRNAGKDRSPQAHPADPRRGIYEAVVAEVIQRRP
jgi:hypothetical protein